jgi:hypothetical protein
MSYQEYSNRARVQHAHAADAATRRQDRGFFGIQVRQERFPNLSVAARLMGNPLGGNPSRLCQLNACVGSTTITVIIDNAWCVLE